MVNKNDKKDIKIFDAQQALFNIYKYYPKRFKKVMLPKLLIRYLSNKQIKSQHKATNYKKSPILTALSKKKKISTRVIISWLFVTIFSLFSLGGTLASAILALLLNDVKSTEFLQVFYGYLGVILASVSVSAGSIGWAFSYTTKYHERQKQKGLVSVNRTEVVKHRALFESENNINVKYEITFPEKENIYGILYYISVLSIENENKGSTKKYKSKILETLLFGGYQIGAKDNKQELIVDIDKLVEEVKADYDISDRRMSNFSIGVLFKNKEGEVFHHTPNGNSYLTKLSEPYNFFNLSFEDVTVGIIPVLKSSKS